MDSFNSFIELLLQVRDKADTCGDKYINLVLSGDSADAQLLDSVLTLLDWADTHQVADALNFFIDESLVDSDEVRSLLAKGCTDPWKLVVRKSALQPAFSQSAIQETVFFLSKDEFDSWVDNIDPLKNPDSQVAENKQLIIYSPSVQEPFGGPCLAVLPLRYKGEVVFSEAPRLLPDSEQIILQVHLVPTTLIRLTPRSLSLTWGNCSQAAAEPFRRASANSLAACMVDVLYGHSRVVIKGVRRLEVPIYQHADPEITVEHLDVFERAVSWLYEERTDTRSRLLGDRISLDADKNKSLVANLAEHLDDSLTQAIEQYRFVVLDRKDEFVREQRELLKDIRKQAEVYAEKTRALVSAFSRDALAAFVFASLSLGRIVDGSTLTISPAGEVFFKILAGYFVISIFLQLIAAWRDISLSNEELLKWSHVSRDYLSKAEVDKHIVDDLGGRRRTFWTFMVGMIVIYGALAASSWNLHTLIKYYSTV